MKDILGFFGNPDRDKDERSLRGQVGIGTMIIFIAMVLVSAVAAAVLTQTSGFLQQKAVSIGEETTDEVSTGLVVNSIEGYTDGTGAGANVSQVALFISTNAGGSNIDLNSTTIKINNGQKESVLAYNGTTSLANRTYDATSGVSEKFSGTSVSAWTGASDTTFTILVTQDADDSATSGRPILNRGDKVALLVNASEVFTDGFPARTQIAGEVVPEIGSPAILSFRTPGTFTQRIINLQ